MHVIEGSLLIIVVTFFLARTVLMILKRLKEYEEARKAREELRRGVSSVTPIPSVHLNPGRSHCVCHVIYTISPENNNSNTAESGSNGFKEDSPPPSYSSLAIQVPEVGSEGADEMEEVPPAPATHVQHI